MDIREVVDTLKGDSSGVRLRQGAIVSVQANGTCTVTVAGSTTQVAGVKVMSSCCPVPGASCWLAVDGRDVFVLGTLAPTGPAFVVVKRATSAQPIPDSTYTEVSFNTEQSDTAGMWDAGTPGRTTCLVPGIYALAGSVMWDNSTIGTRTARLMLNGASALAFDKTEAFSTSHTNTVVSISALSLGDYISLDVLQNSGSALNVLNDSATFLRAVWIGPKG